MKRRSMMLAGLVAVSFIAGAGWFLYRLIRIADETERVWMSMDYVSVAMVEFLDAKKKWPTSWEELATVQPTVGHVSIPRDLEWVERHVSVDFRADVREIALETPKTFTGFSPTGEPNFDETVLYEAVIVAAQKIEAQAATNPATRKN